jgi:hypothetical protein
MTLILRLALALLSTYRLAVLVSEEDGPLFLLARLREFTDVKRAVEQGGDVEGDGSELGYGPWASLDDGLRCAWCAGVWAAALCAALVWWPTLAGDVFLTWLGLAGGQLFLERWHSEQL